MAAAARVLRVLDEAGIPVDQAAGLRRVPLRRHRRAVPHHRQAAGGPPAVARLLELCEAAPARAGQHAVTSRPMMSKYDPWVNMLRTTVAAFSATVGGADAVTVQPFDRPLGRPDAFGRRIARNQMALLNSTSPTSAGHRPRRWCLGGRTAHPRPRRRGLGVPPGPRGRRVARRRGRRHRRRARPAGRHPPPPVTGLTEYPNLAETLPERDGEPDDVRRYGAAFEALRDEPATTPVFLATMGSVAAHTARATFATNLFAAGGIAVERRPDPGRRRCARGVRRPAGRLPGRPRRGVRRVGSRPRRPPPRGRRPRT